MLNELMRAIALLLVIEGIVPFLSPRKMKEILLQLQNMSDNSFRVMGLLSMISGIVLLYISS